MKYDLVALGNPVYDIIHTPYVSTKGRVLSGCSTNACLAARKLGLSKVGLIGSLGRDYNKRFLHDLEKYGIDPLLIIDAQETGGFKLVYDAAGDRTLEVIGIASNITAENLPEECLNAQTIMLGPILGELDIALVEYLSTSCDAPLFLDPQGFTRVIKDGNKIHRTCDRKEIKKLVSLVDWVKPNEQESVVMTGETDPVKAAKTLISWGAHFGIVTLAERGSIVTDGNKIFRIPAFKTQANDPTGAGDTYAGSYIYSLLKRSQEFAENAVFASAAASQMVEATGPDFPMTLTEVENRVKKIRRKIKKLK